MSGSLKHANAIGVRSMRKNQMVLLSVLAVINLLNYVDRISLSLLLEPIKRELLLSDGQMGLLSGVAFSLFYALLGIPIARIADRGGKAWLLPLCVFLWSLMTMASGLATSFVALFLARMLVGVGEAGCSPTSFSIIAENFEPQRRLMRAGCSGSRSG
jgi:MFS family permease